MSPEEVTEEKVKEMMQLVLIEEVYAKALQVKHPIIDWKVYIEGQRSFWKITRLGGSSTSYQFFIDLLKHLDREDLNQLWRLVKETFSNRPPTNKEIFMLVDKDYPLRKGLALVMICYKLQVENFSQMANDLVLKIYKITNSSRQQVIEFPLAEQLPTASKKKMPLLEEKRSHCQEDRTAINVKKKLPVKGGSYAKNGFE
nr:hypothetical protein [Tanacetum cinerariifolium]